MRKYVRVTNKTNNMRQVGKSIKRNSTCACFFLTAVPEDKHIEIGYLLSK